jgi:hypothetical protein
MPRAAAAVLLIISAACADAARDDAAASRDSAAAANPSAVNEDSALYALRVFPLDSFPEIPLEIRAGFMAGGCRDIAQTYSPREANNVISGEFATPGQTDWAALCYRGGKSELMVVWGGQGKCPSRISSLPAASTRYIALATPNDIFRLAQALNGPTPPNRDHDGIHEGVAGQGSTIRYCHNGEWMRLQGMN